MEFLAAVGRPRGVLFRPREVKEMEDEEDEGGEKRKANKMDGKSRPFPLCLKILPSTGDTTPIYTFANTHT